VPHDDVDELLRLASQREQLERFRKKTFTNPLDPEDEDCDLLRCLDYVLSKRFWQLAYQIGERIGWHPGWTSDEVAAAVSGVPECPYQSPTLRRT
jgi:hypothetical protein